MNTIQMSTSVVKPNGLAEFLTSYIGFKFNIVFFTRFF